jgi:hypothetical protein
VSDSSAALARLEADGLIERRATRYRTTRRWQAAMARAAFALQQTGDDGSDLRVPIIHALIALYGQDYPDGELASFAEALLPVEHEELAPSSRG